MKSAAGSSAGLGSGRPDVVSVVVPVYNGASFVAEAIESVLEQRADAGVELEVIVVDDGSTDESASIARRYSGVTVLKQDNTGCTGARNAGVLASHGELVAFIDQDDRWRPGKLRKQVEALRDDPQAGYALGMITLFLEPGCDMPRWMGARGWVIGTQRVGHLPGTMVVRRTVFERLGLFDERYNVGSDADWLVRARDAGVGVVVVPDVVLDKRIHSNNLSGSPQGSSDMLAILSESIKRRRASEPGQ